jgi:hypothetical protein
MRRLPLLAAIILSGCVRSSTPQATMQEEDKSIIFPEFYARFPVVVGKQKDQPYELDGVTLRAIGIAANDYIPPSSQHMYCWETQEAQEYRVIRQGDIVFVSISVDPTYCKVDFLLLDNGMRYAISTDGRILRRLATGEPDGSRLKPSDAGAQEYLGDPVPDSMVGSTLLGGCISPMWLDGGTDPACPGSQPRSLTTLDGGSPLDGGTAPVPAR